MREDIISERLYNRMSEKYGEYKVTRFLDVRGKTKVEYYEIKFKDTGNITEASIKNILTNKVIDKKKKKYETKKNNWGKRAIVKQLKDSQLKYLHNPKNIICLDLATRSTGWAVRLENGNEFYGYIFQECDDEDYNDLTKRVAGMVEKIEYLVEKYNIDAVVVEAIPDKVFFKGKSINTPIRTLKALTHIRGTTLVYMHRANIQYISISPASWSNYIKRGRYSELSIKDRTLKCMIEDYGLDFKSMFSGKNDEEIDKKVWEDVADAYGILKYVVNNRIAQ